MSKVLFIIVLLVGLVILPKLTYAEMDTEYRMGYEVSGAINDNLSFKVKPEFRYNDDMSTHYYSHFDIGLDWKINKYFTLGPYYQYVDQSKDDVWAVEYRPHLDGTFSLKFFDWSISDRNKMEYRIKEDNEFFRYANKLTIKTPKFTEFEIQPYVADEMFYDFDVKEWNKNNAFAGVDFKIVENLTASIYYFTESNKKEDDWTEVSGLGTSLKYSF
ncbi:MAG: DUF2490 domain-containing protein [Candidatus Ratteibacteria bacterium]|nr:DUF2490 domain-containing protein [Candidatus Ratteibacteria bacterium]